MPGSGVQPGTQATQGTETNGVWRASLSAIIVLTAALVALFWPTVATLRYAWSDTDTLTYTHGYLIAAMCVWLLARAGRSIDGPMTPDWRPAVLLAGLSFCWLLFYRAGIELLHQALLPLMAIVAACAALGIANGRKLSFAFAYFYFAVPIWSAGNEILQSITVFAVRILLKITAIPAYVTGNLVHIPSGAFEIAGGCSGVHFFIVALAIAAIFGEIHRDSPRVRLQQLMLAAVLAMVSNWLRVFTIIVAGHLTDMQHFLITVDHYYFGWVLFVFTMAAFFWLAGRMPVRTLETGSSAPGGARGLSWAGGVLLAIMAAGIGPAVNVLRPVTDALVSHEVLPAATDRWRASLSLPDTWHPVYPGADRAEFKEYQSNGRVATAFVAQYLRQHQGKELVGFGNALAGSGGAVDDWRVIQTARGAIAVFETDRAGVRAVVAYRYMIDGARVTGDFKAQMAYAVASLNGPALSQIVAARAQCGSDCATALADACDLLDDIDATIASSHHD